MNGLITMLAQATPVNPNAPVTITFIPSQIITWIIIGLIAGYVANLLVRGRRMNTLVTVFIGVLGAFVGNWIDLITAMIGAIIVLIIFLSIFRHR